MKIVSREEDYVIVKVENDLDRDRNLTAFSHTGELLWSGVLLGNSAAELKLPYNADVELTDGVNTERLYIGSNDVDRLRKAAERRVPKVRLGI